MTDYPVWDRFIRAFHIALATGFLANALVIDEDAALHDSIGYALAALVGARLLWGLIGPRPARFTALRLSRAALLSHLRDIVTHAPRARLGHSPLGGLMVLNLLGSVLLICATGVLLTLPAPPGWAEEAHEVLVGWTGICITLHVLAVLWESLRTGVNLPAAMITGRKRVPEAVDIME